MLTDGVVIKTYLPQYSSSPRGLHVVEIIRGPSGQRLKNPLMLTLPDASSKGEENLRRFVIDAFSCKMSALIEFTLRSWSATELAKRIMLSNSGSRATFYQYMYGVHRYCNYAGKAPDQLISECQGPEGEALPKPLSVHAKVLGEFVGELQAEGLAPGTINNHVKGVKALYHANSLRLELPYKLSKRVIYKDRSPTPEELQYIIEISNLREKVIVSILALGGFRVGTLCRLQYRHVRHDLENGIVPLHIHVEAEITKGKYNDYDTFLAGEAVQYLKQYLTLRSMGSPWGDLPPEELIDESPLIRDEQRSKPKPLTPGAIHWIIHNLYIKAGLIKAGAGRRYKLRVHSLRKFFRTQLAALGTNTDYIDYMMGHTIDTYHNIQMKGIDFLRGIYAASGLSIKPKTRLSKIEFAKETLRMWGINPEELLTKNAFAEPHRISVSPQERETEQIRVLSQALKESVIRELKTETLKKEVA